MKYTEVEWVAWGRRAGWDRCETGQVKVSVGRRTCIWTHWEVHGMGLGVWA